MEDFDLAIVGASFAGLLCARAAAARGLRTIILESKRHPAARVHTTGILVKEAGEEIDTPPHLTRTIHAVRLYAPNLASIDLTAPGYYFLTTDTAGLLAWLTEEATKSGAEIRCGTRIDQATRDGDRILLPQPGVRAGYLVGADGARSTVARLFGLGRNTQFLLGLEREYPNLPDADANFLHCFLDSRLARGYLAWVAPAPGFTQVGLATSGSAKPDLQAFLDHTEPIFGYSRAAISERRSGLIPCGGPVSPAGAPGVMLIGDAAGHVSPMTGGGIRLAFRYGRRAGQLIHDHLTRGGPRPDLALAGELPSFTLKLAMRRVMDLGPPNWLFNAVIATPMMRWVARRIYFHRRVQPGFEAPPPSPGA
ncbi:MAG: NAD(P)/FAD-dependent oxidoreductase [Hyphomicrobiales bacterium]